MTLVRIDVTGVCVIILAVFFAAAWLLMEAGRERAFIRSIPAKFRALVATPDGTPSDWTGPLHAAAPSALRAARHLAGLGHLLPKRAPWRAAQLARNLAARAQARARKLPVPGAGSFDCPVTTATCPSDHRTPKVDSPAPGTTPSQGAGTADRAHGDPVTPAGNPAAAGGALPALPPPPDSLAGLHETGPPPLPPHVTAGIDRFRQALAAHPGDDTGSFAAIIEAGAR